MFLESSPCESFIKSSSLSKLELQSFVEEKTKSFWVITSLQSKSFSTPSLSFRRKSSKSFNESFLEETKSFCWSSYYPQEICSYLLDSTKQVFLWRSLSPIFFFGKKSKSFVAINVFLIKEISVFHNPGIIICYGKKIETTTKKWTPREKKSQATIKLNIQIVWNWNSKIQGLKTKKQKVFEFSTESQMPKQNGKKYNQEYYNKKVLNKKMRKLKKKAIWISHLTQQSFINSLSKQWLVLEQNWHWNNIQSFRKSTHSNVFLYSIFQPSWGAWEPTWFVPRPQYQAASVDFMPAMPRPSPSPPQIPSS